MKAVPFIVNFHDGICIAHTDFPIEMFLSDAQFMGVITFLGAMRKTDVYAFAQHSQLFPFPCKYRYCADSNTVTFCYNV